MNCSKTPKTRSNICFFLSTIDEHERIQKKVFTNWINYYVPNCIEKGKDDQIL